MNHLPLLGASDPFPNPLDERDDDRLALGADLSAERLLSAYDLGIFPWFSFRDWPFPVWYCPKTRFVIFPEEIHVSHSMRTLINSGRYRVTFNQAFREVIEACGSVDSRNRMEGAWLGDDIIEAYTRLHELRRAMSVEVWDGERLVGGLYGVTVGKVFCGESMFSRVPNGSKLALIHLAKSLPRNAGYLIDCQYETPHLRSMGGRPLPYIFYLPYLHPMS